MDVNNGFFEVRQYAKPCAFCTRNNLFCCEATRSGSKKCEACRVVKGVCAFSKTPVISEGRKVWCNPTTKSYGFEHPTNEVPTDDFDSGIVSTVQSGKRSVLKKAGIPTGGIPILFKGWVNHKGVEGNPVGSSERSARSQLRQAQEAKEPSTPNAKRLIPSLWMKQLGQPSTPWLLVASAKRMVMMKMMMKMVVSFGVAIRLRRKMTSIALQL
ncbi:hypothetical protein PPACK8108_LOCUS23803, partial [Phakopsora pachyrhizi]